MISRASFVLSRVLVAAFCWTTAMFAFLASSPFAYLQFLKPRVFPWVGVFSDTHHWLTWIALAVFAGALRWPARNDRVVGRMAVVMAAAGAMAAAANTVNPVLPSLTDGARSVVVGIVALMPSIGLALLDHLSRRSVLLTARVPFRSDDVPGVDGRLVVAALGSTLTVVGMSAVLTSFSVAHGFEPDLMLPGLAVGAAISTLDHAVIFIGAAVALALIARVARGRFLASYLLLLAAIAAMLALLFAGIVGEAMGLAGAWSWLAAAAVGASIAGVWSSLAIARFVRAPVAVQVPLDVLSGPRKTGGSLALGLGGVVVVLLGFMALSARIDWDFALLKTGVVVVWLMTFLQVYGATPIVSGGGVRSLALVTLLPLVLHGTVELDAASQHVLERYAVHNPSFLVADGLLRDRPNAPSFDRYLRANTGLGNLDVSPVAIDFVAPLAPAEGRRPHIFLLVVDSLRADYLSPYNPRVGFTPRIAEFAAENPAFTNAFTRYGGTGLSMPAIWAGSAIVHKQYVQPFGPMNALEKLVNANGYQRIFSRDHITSALWMPSARDIELDRGKAEMDFEFCGTLGELSETLGSGVVRSGPVFAQTRALNLHVAAVRNGYVPPGKRYDGFEPPYAWRVEQIDACFGRFIDRLKAFGMYDQSLVVLTADHGELIGEDGRWGHSYHLFPEVIQVPLLMHLPAQYAGARPDTAAAAFSTDITPTIYDVLGYRPVASHELMGRSLLDVSPEATRARRERGVVLSASYGAVYALVSDNGRRLFIADAIKGETRAYRHADAGAWRETNVDAGWQALGQLHIRRHVDAIARLYGIERRF